MDSWQIDHIRKNFPSLLHSTSCSSTFLACLYKDGVVSNEEIQILDSISTQMAQAKRLYEIVQTRKDSYNLLKQALKDTAQTGALAILEQCKQQNVLIPFQSCKSISYFRDLLLGRGCYGTRVFKGMYENRDVAVKRLNRDEVEMADVKEEINFLTMLDSHKNVVRYFKTEVSDDFIFIALELCDVNLLDWVIQSQRAVEISAMEVIKQSTEGVAHLHSNRVIHRDLKPNNILLVSRSVGDTQVKISDFGLSKRIPVGASKLSGHTVGVGTVEWMAPEVAGGLTLKNNVAVGMSFASDVFSLGCIYYFVLSSGLHPFGEAARCQGNILDGKYQLNEQNITPIVGNVSGLIKLIGKMIALDRGERPSAFEVLKWLPDLSTGQKAANVSTPQQNVIGKELANQTTNHAVEENAGVASIASGMDSLWLTEVHQQKATQLTKSQETNNIEMAKWQDTVEPNLHVAIRQGNMQAIKELIQFGADVNAKNSKNDTPIMVAAASKADSKMTYDMIIYLMENGADAFETDSEGHTFLHKLFSNSKTSSSGFGGFAQFLVENKLSNLFNIKDIKSGITPLSLAMRKMELDMATISLLRENGVELNLVDQNGSSSYAAEENKNGKLLAELHKKGEIKHSTLAEAIKAMDIDSVKALVWNGADVNEQNEYLRTPLHLAACMKNKEFSIKIIKFLIDSGAKVNTQDENKLIFLHLFVWLDMAVSPTQFDALATFLVSKGLSSLFNTPDINLRTPFQLAVQHVKIERATLSLLKNHGIDFNAADRRQKSVLYSAVVFNRPIELISELVNLGADPKQLTADQESMLHIAAWSRNASVVKFFLDKGLDVNAQDYIGRTPLHCALLWAKKEDVLNNAQLLLQNGADSEIVDYEWVSARDYFNKNRYRYSDTDKISTCFSPGSSH